MQSSVRCFLSMSRKLYLSNEFYFKIQERSSFSLLCLHCCRQMATFTPYRHKEICQLWLNNNNSNMAGVTVRHWAVLTFKLCSCVVSRLEKKTSTHLQPDKVVFTVSESWGHAHGPQSLWYTSSICHKKICQSTYCSLFSTVLYETLMWAIKGGKLT